MTAEAYPAKENPAPDPERRVKQAQRTYLQDKLFKDDPRPGYEGILFHNLTPRALKAYIVIRRHADEYGISELTFKYISYRAGFKVRKTLYLALTELKETGLIIRMMKPSKLFAALEITGGRADVWIFHT